ncbi:MAG: TetR/AcrR family transcriptional regulator [Rhodobacteraceae bacterium]|nr:TetR/AcrR family transcriptional regulator [Paracoccaceae bacterium]
MKESIADLRQKAILTSAWDAFSAYGYRKTSMDDIARGADMSRPALYLQYRNKRDIFRTLVQLHYDQACKAAAAALAGPGTPSDLLTAAFMALGGEVLEVLLNSPHGMEMLDTTTATAADIVLDGEMRLHAEFALWLARLEASGNGHLQGSAQDVAATILAGLKGIKMAGTDYTIYQKRLGLLGAMLGAGLLVL